MDTCLDGHYVHEAGRTGAFIVFILIVVILIVFILIVFILIVVILFYLFLVGGTAHCKVRRPMQGARG